MSDPMLSRRSWLLLACMATSSIFAEALRPRFATGGEVDLETMIPARFSNWRAVPGDVVTAGDELRRDALARTYTAVLGRTYREESNDCAVMLSIAYGREQTRRSRIHWPEVCYAAQGFSLSAGTKVDLLLDGRLVPATRFIAESGPRREPVTYWTRVGDEIVRGQLAQKLAIVEEGLSRRIADGLVFRVSSLGADVTAEHEAQVRFVDELLRALPESSRTWLVGRA